MAEKDPAGRVSRCSRCFRARGHYSAYTYCVLIFSVRTYSVTYPIPGWWRVSEWPRRRRRVGTSVFVATSMAVGSSAGPGWLGKMRLPPFLPPCHDDPLVHCWLTDLVCPCSLSLVHVCIDGASLRTTCWGSMGIFLMHVDG